LPEYFHVFKNTPLNVLKFTTNTLESLYSLFLLLLIGIPCRQVKNMAWNWDCYHKNKSGTAGALITEVGMVRNNTMSELQLSEGESD